MAHDKTMSLAPPILTRKEKACLYSANRGCGLSYRSACKHGIERARSLKERGYLYLIDRGENKKVGRWIFRTTQKGKAALI